MAALPIIPLFNPLDPEDWFEGIVNTLATGLTNVLGEVFVGMVQEFLVIDPLYYQEGANATFIQNLQYSLILFPTVIVLGTIAALFSEAPEGSYLRQGIRIVYVFSPDEFRHYLVIGDQSGGYVPSARAN
ncbi:hypothetical protein [Halosimplex salinum]|uniref:hypothetical protein n=1 Tax=Halosimplex salinum TaxID=1710538 RepID=UPI000F47C5B7|nr:hypothetical protein [Halosimplex salinum]